MLSIITTVLTLVAQFASSATVTEITSIIAALEQIVPLLTKEYQDIKPFVTNIINALRGNGQITADQQAQLDALNAATDAAFEAAAADLNNPPPPATS